jgi:spoIIIJ-associated protein
MSAESTEDVTAAATEEQDDTQEESLSKTASRLEEEGDIAADYLEELLDIADIDGDIDIEVRNGRTYISIGTDEESAALDSLVGRDGEVLEALQ